VPDHHTQHQTEACAAEEHGNELRQRHTDADFSASNDTPQNDNICAQALHFDEFLIKLRSYSIVIRRRRWNDSNFWFRFAVPRKERGRRERSDCGYGRRHAVRFNFCCDFGKKLLRFLYRRRNCGPRLERSSVSEKLICVYCHSDLK
jgi:hypothetical protein